MPTTRSALVRPKLDYPRVPYHGLLRRTVERFPDKSATVFNDQMMTFRELEGTSNALANGLRALGVGKGDRVALLMTTRPEYLVSFEATSKVCGTVTAINPAYHADEVEYQLNDSEARVLIVHEERYPIVESIRANLKTVRHVLVIGDAPSGTESWDAIVRDHPATAPPEVDIDIERDLIALPYSSGTTGLPKGVMLTHRNLVCNHLQCTSAARVTERDVLLLFLPFYHIYGSMLMGASIASGATICIMERFDAMTALAITQRYKVTLFYAVPPVLLALSQMPQLKQFDLSSVRYIMSGAAPLPPEIARRMQEASGIGVLQGYGLTEAAPITHLNPVDNRTWCGSTRSACTSPTRRSASSTPTTRAGSWASTRSASSSCAARTSCRLLEGAGGNGAGAARRLAAHRRHRPQGRRRLRVHRRSQEGDDQVQGLRHRARRARGGAARAPRRRRLRRRTAQGRGSRRDPARLHRLRPRSDGERGRADPLRRRPRRHLQTGTRRHLHRRDPEKPVGKNPAPRAAGKD